MGMQLQTTASVLHPVKLLLSTKSKSSAIFSQTFFTVSHFLKLFTHLS